MPDVQKTKECQPPVKFPSFSVIIPVKNGAKTIDECLRSVFNADYPQDRLEVIVVDDGSRDETVDIVKRYPVKLFFAGKGVSNARNIGWRNSRGEYILFLDSDCKIGPNYLREVLKKIAYDTGIVNVPPIPHPIDTWVAREIAKAWLYDHQKLSLGNGTLSVCTTGTSLFRRKALEDVGGFDERVVFGGEDTDLSHRIFLKGWKIRVTSEAIAYHMPRQTLRGLGKQYFGYGRGSSVFYRIYRSKNSLATDYPPLTTFKSWLYKAFKLRDPLLVILSFFIAYLFTAGFLVGLATWAKN